MFNVWLLFSFMMSVKLQAVSLIRADINQTGSLMERRMQCDYIKKKPQTRPTNKSSGGECADVR